MISINLGWAQFSQLGSPISYADRDSNYYLFQVVDSIQYTCRIDKSGQDAADFEANYKQSANGLI